MEPTAQVTLLAADTRRPTRLVRAEYMQVSQPSR